MSITVDDLPGLNCGACGYGSCEALAERLRDDPDALKALYPVFASGEERADRLAARHRARHVLQFIRGLHYGCGRGCFALVAK